MLRFKGAPASGNAWRWLFNDDINALTIATLLWGGVNDENLYVSGGSWPTLVCATNTFGFSDTDWYNVVVTRSDATATAYVNGVQDGMPGTSSVSIPSHVVQFGGGVNGISLVGAMDDVAIWNQALTPTQVAAIYAGASPLTIVAEPSSLALLAAGLLGFLAYAWRKRR